MKEKLVVILMIVCIFLASGLLHFQVDQLKYTNDKEAEIDVLKEQVVQLRMCLSEVGKNIVRTDARLNKLEGERQ